MRISDWSSDVCSSDLRELAVADIGGIRDLLAMGIDDTQAGVGRAQQIGEIETLARNRVEAIEGGLVRRIERTGGGLTGDQRRRRRDLDQPDDRKSTRLNSRH